MRTENAVVTGWMIYFIIQYHPLPYEKYLINKLKDSNSGPGMSEELNSLGAVNTSGMACDKEIHLDATRPKRSEGVTVSCEWINKKQTDLQSKYLQRHHLQFV